MYIFAKKCNSFAYLGSSYVHLFNNINICLGMPCPQSKHTYAPCSAPIFTCDGLQTAGRGPYWVGKPGSRGNHGQESGWSVSAAENNYLYIHVRTQPHPIPIDNPVSSVEFYRDCGLALLPQTTN